MTWEVVIGLETHVQLLTRSKMFSGAATAFGAAPNTQACGVDIALPGALPVLNKRAVECAIRFGLAANSMNAENLSRRSIFARKNYFYPDLPKGYQISQYELPIVRGGVICIRASGVEKRIRLTRAHLEEDAGKSIHEGMREASGIDLNRAGTPLLEIVSEPDMRSAEEAVAYARELHKLVTWIGICDGNMQEGSFRCDANVSVRRPGQPLGTRREIKNLNSFRFLQHAIEYETRWQIETLEGGGRIEQATVLFDPDSGATHAMRTKEDAHDYRYFPDPDLLPLEVSEDWIAKVRAELPELPQVKRERYQREFALTEYDSLLVTENLATARYFEDLVARLSMDRSGGDSPEAAKLAANWMTGELAAALNRENRSIERSPVSSEMLSSLLVRVRDGTLSNKIAKEQVFPVLWERGAAMVTGGVEAGAGQTGATLVDRIIAERGLKQISDGSELERICDDVIRSNSRQVEDYRAGKDKAFHSLVGQVMKVTRGKANPQQVNDILRRKLSP